MPYAALAAAAAREKKEVCAVLVAQKSKVNWGAKKEAPDERRERVLRCAGRWSCGAGWSWLPCIYAPSSNKNRCK